MDAELAEQIRANLIDKRTHVKEWLEKTDTIEKQLQLGTADEKAVQAHQGSISAVLLGKFACGKTEAGDT